MGKVQLIVGKKGRTFYGIIWYLKFQYDNFGIQFLKLLHYYHINLILYGSIL